MAGMKVTMIKIPLGTNDAIRETAPPGFRFKKMGRKKNAPEELPRLAYENQTSGRKKRGTVLDSKGDPDANSSRGGRGGLTFAKKKIRGKFEPSWGRGAMAGRASQGAERKSEECGQPSNP